MKNKYIYSKLKISIIGLGYVGLPLAIEFSKKFDVIGYDKDDKRIKELQKGFDRTSEVSSNQIKNKGNISSPFINQSDQKLYLKHYEIFDNIIIPPITKPKKPGRLSRLFRSSKKK